MESLLITHSTVQYKKKHNYSQWQQISVECSLYFHAVVSLGEARQPPPWQQPCDVKKKMHVITLSEYFLVHTCKKRQQKSYMIAGKHATPTQK